MITVEARIALMKHECLQDVGCVCRRANMAVEAINLAEQLHRALEQFVHLRPTTIEWTHARIHILGLLNGKT